MSCPVLPEASFKRILVDGNTQRRRAAESSCQMLSPFYPRDERGRGEKANRPYQGIILVGGNNQVVVKQPGGSTKGDKSWEEFLLLLVMGVMKMAP